MFASRLFWRTSASSCAVILFWGLMLDSAITMNERDVLQKRLRDQLYTVADSLRTHFPAEVELRDAIHSKQLKRLASDNNVSLLIVDRNGAVVADTGESVDPSKSGFDWEEFRAARRRDFGVIQRRNPETGERSIFCAMRVGSKESPVGYIRAGASMLGIESAVAKTRWLIWTMCVFLGLIAVGLSSLLVARTIEPLEELTKAAKSLGKGKFVRTTGVPFGNEFDELTRVFNQMSDDLSARVGRLEQSRQELQESSELQETVLATMVEGVVVVDEHQQVIFANRAARAQLEMKNSGMVGQRLWEVARHVTLQEVVQNALKGDTQNDIEFEIARTKSVIAMTASRLPGDPCPGAVLVLHDVTKLRRLEGMRRDFVSNVSHELKTPLTSIRAFTETLLDGAIDDPAHNRQFLGRIQEQAERLHALILDLLNLGRIESEQNTFHVVPVSVTNTIRLCAEQHQAVAEQKQLKLEVELPENDFRLMVDPDGLRTILDNLVGNAMSYTPPNGTVTMCGFEQDGMGCVRVQDTGPGISQQHQERIFERFYRVDQARSRELGGTGLGLSIVKHLTQVFGGDIKVESELHQGSAFTVSLPLVRENSP